MHKKSHTITMLKPTPGSIKAFWQSGCRWPSVQEALFLLTLTLMGLAGNYLNLELFTGVNFLFGSIATMIAVRTSGTLWATLVGIVIGSYSYVLWGHPYGMIIFGLEALFLGFVISLSKRESLILADVVYWIFVGFPLIWAFHFYQLGLPAPATILIALIQMANGILNVVLASFIMQFTPMIQRLNLKGVGSAAEKFSVYSVISTLVSIFILLPLMGGTILSSKVKLEEVQEQLKLNVETKLETVEREITSILSWYSTILASTVAPELNKDTAAWESTVKGIGENVIPGLLNTEIFSADGEILLSYPEQRSGISEYAYQASFVTPNSRYLSRIQADEGLKSGYFTMIATISGGRFLAASFSPMIFAEVLTKLSLGGQQLEMIDGQGTAIASGDIKDLSGFVRGINPHHLLPPNAELPSMVRWRQAYWEQTAFFKGGGDWIIRVTASMEQSIAYLEATYIRKFLSLLTISIGALLLLPFLSRRFSSPLGKVTRAADMFAHSVERTDVIWPTSNIIEVDSLVGHFQEFVETINAKQLALDKVRSEQEIERTEAAAQIMHASKLATLGEMATSVAHELNQPLNVIRMAAGNSRRKISQGTAKPDYLKDKLERIEGQTARAAAIVDHMRMFGREANEDSEPIDPRNVVTNTLDLMGEQLRLSGIEIVTELPADCSFILGHTIQLERVLLNLLTNARDAMDERNRAAKITLRVFEDDKGVHITSEDTGGGIPQDALPRIFEPFYTTKEMGKGTGLGLSVSYGIVRDMYGSISVENINDGARFTITLPAIS